MTNEDKFAKECLRIKMEDNFVAINITNKQPCKCKNTVCKNCLFNYQDLDCDEVFKKWLQEEYAEPIFLNEKERQALVVLEGIKYIAKDDDGVVYGFTTKPVQSNGYWYVAEEDLDGICVNIAAILDDCTMFM